MKPHPEWYQRLGLFALTWQSEKHCPTGSRLRHRVSSWWARFAGEPAFWLWVVLGLLFWRRYR